MERARARQKRQRRREVKDRRQMERGKGGVSNLPGFLSSGRILHSSLHLTGWDPCVIAASWTQHINPAFTYTPELCVFVYVCELTYQASIPSVAASVCLSSLQDEPTLLKSTHIPITTLLLKTFFNRGSTILPLCLAFLYPTHVCEYICTLRKHNRTYRPPD